MGENRPFDYVCAICDNGGTILSCKGKCLRSFHPTPDDSDCSTLGYNKEEVNEIKNYLCSNCLLKQHQCFVCGQLGSSGKLNREVYICSVSDCGHHYHPKCVSKLIHPNSEKNADQLAKYIKTGETFTCPRHKCAYCKGVENHRISALQFALCRRCPVAYHRRCLPREISFEDRGSNLTRAWDLLIPDRILIYCMKHRIDPSLGTPLRNHIRFPPVISQAKFKIQSNQKMVFKSKRLCDIDKQPDLKRARVSEEISVEREKPKGLENNIFQRENYPDKGKQKVSEYYSDKGKQKVAENNYSYREKPKYLENNPQREKLILGNNNSQKVSESAITREANLHLSSFPEIDKDTENKIRDLWQKCSSSLTLENVRERFKMPSTHRGMTKHNIDQSITEDLIRENVQIIRNACARLQNGERPEQVREFCPEDLVLQVAKWKNKMNVYLAPFLHMNRYTSFGRHFTKPDKLVKIVERLQWYVQDGDMVVDFCCGSNDFSILMRDKLESVGKKCLFKNFDLHEPKNDFNFEKRDWMTVQPDELPDGSRLIMGLNPPFGVRAGLANKFIDQALKFRPKIIILIVPKETQRLDEKADYDLTWQDGYFLSGKSFYLPGSIDDEHNRMDQWNMNPPPLYLWTRTDWAPIHNQIAEKHGHLSQFEEPDEEPQTLINPNSTATESEQTLINPNLSPNEGEQVLINPNSIPLDSDQILNPNYGPKEPEYIPNPNSSTKESSQTLNPNSNPKESSQTLNSNSSPAELSQSLNPNSKSEESSQTVNPKNSKPILESELEKSEEEEYEEEFEEEEYDDDDDEFEKEKEEKTPRAISTIEEGEITELPLGEISKTVNNNNDDDNQQDVSGELIFLADMDISSPEYDEYNSAFNNNNNNNNDINDNNHNNNINNNNNNDKEIETGGSSRMEFDYGGFESDASEPYDPTLDWWSQDDNDDDDDDE